MKEKLQEYALLAEIIGGFAVLVTLIILVLSVRENTELIRVSMYADHIQRVNEMDLFSISTPQLASFHNQVVQGDLEELNPVQYSQAMTLYVISLRRNETAYFMWQAGFLGEQEWGRISKAACKNFTIINNRPTIRGSDDLLDILTEDYRNFLLTECVE